MNIPDDTAVSPGPEGSPGSPYRVSQNAFHGPLDLLLYLVRKSEVDVMDVSIVELADQFVEYLQTLRELDVESVGDFLVTAATLMEIKSRSLLPHDESKAAKDGDDPHGDLVKQLIEYRTFKDAASALEERAETFSTRLARTVHEDTKSGELVPVRPVELWDLVAAFARIMRETQSLALTTIQVDDTPQHVYAELVLTRLRSLGRVAFRDLFTPPYTKARLIGLFLAVLELIKDNSILLEQLDPFGEITLTLGEGEGKGRRAIFEPSTESEAEAAE
ncbi:MAG: segregation/condensation protein A [Gemmataceae bacterium]